MEGQAVLQTRSFNLNTQHSFQSPIYWGCSCPALPFLCPTCIQGSKGVYWKWTEISHYTSRRCKIQISFLNGFQTSHMQKIILLVALSTRGACQDKHFSDKCYRPHSKRKSGTQSPWSDKSPSTRGRYSKDKGCHKSMQVFNSARFK